MTVQINAMRAYRPFGSVGFLYDGVAGSPGAPSTARGGCSTAIQSDREGGATRRQRPTRQEKRSPPLVRSLEAEGADILYVGPDTFITGALQDEVSRAALEARLPTFSALEKPVRRSGALFGIFSPETNLGRLAALKALRILAEHSSPAHEPIETLDQFAVLINMQTALRLQLYPPVLLLDSAEVVSTEDLSADHVGALPTGARHISPKPVNRCSLNATQVMSSACGSLPAKACTTFTTWSGYAATGAILRYLAEGLNQCRFTEQRPVRVPCLGDAIRVQEQHISAPQAQVSFGKWRIRA